MKKILLLSAIFMIAITTNLIAQTSKGNWLLGGSASFSSQKNGDYKFTSFTIAPAAGYFVIDDLGVGAALAYSNFKEDNSDAVNSFIFAPFVRYYFLPLGKGAKLFANGSFGFGSAKAGGDSESLTTWQIAAGPAIFLNQSIALEIALGYGSTKYKSDDDPTNSFGINVGFQIHFKK